MSFRIVVCASVNDSKASGQVMKLKHMTNSILEEFCQKGNFVADYVNVSLV